jgi:hypothetical protein
MATRKTGSRQIVVDDVTYRWRIRHKPTYMQGAFACAMFAAVELADDPGRVLLVQCGPRPDNWIEAASQTVTPGRIAVAIRAGIAAGWNPGENGSAFVIELPTDTLTGGS